MTLVSKLKIQYRSKEDGNVFNNGWMGVHTDKLFVLVQILYVKKANDLDI